MVGVRKQTFKNEFKAHLIARVIRARQNKPSAPISYFLDEAYRVILNGNELFYLAKLALKQCNEMPETEAEEKLTELLKVI